MTKLPVRLLLLLVCLAAVGGAAYMVWIAEQNARARETASRRFADGARSAAIAVSDLRGAEQAYVAAGQGQDFWFARVSALVTDLHDKLSALKPLAIAPDASLALDDAAGALQDFEQMDRRAREFVRNHQTTPASDLIFADGFDLTRKAGDALDRALTAELSDRDAVLGFLKRREIYVLAGSAGATLLAVVLLVPVRRRDPEPAAHAGSPVESVPLVSRETFADLDDFGVVPVRPAPPVPTVNLDSVASLCVDLAKVADVRALPPLLERAAAVLDASGIVVWIADPDGRELAPILVHGYPPQLANRLVTLTRDAQNVTAAAFRTGLLQTVKGDAVSNGAVAAPLVAVGGCVGVMAAEMQHGGEQQESLLSAARIIAAQLATLVGPPSVRSAKTEAAG